VPASRYGTGAGVEKLCGGGVVLSKALAALAANPQFFILSIFFGPESHLDFLWICWDT
jgi:hypothetical protein